MVLILIYGSPVVLRKNKIQKIAIFSLLSVIDLVLQQISNANYLMAIVYAQLPVYLFILFFLLLNLQIKKTLIVSLEIQSFEDRSWLIDFCSMIKDLFYGDMDFNLKKSLEIQSNLLLCDKEHKYTKID